MNKKQYALKIIKELFHYSGEPTAKDKSFRRVILASFGLYILSLCILLLSGLAAFSIWLMYGTLYTMIILESIAVVWRIWDIAKRIKKDQQEE